MKFPRRSPRLTSRRSFLPAPRPSGSSSGLWNILDEKDLVRLGRRAMACQFEILFPSSRRRAISRVQAALDEVDRYEQLMTVHREDSHLSEINRKAGLEPVRVDEDLYPVLSLSLQMWKETAGAFDITAGPLMRCWGFSSRQGRKPTREEIEDTLQGIGSGFLDLDPKARTVLFRRPLELNLGGIGKGYALDRICRPLQAAGFPSLFLHAGHSAILACGSPNPDVPGEGWLVGVRDPSDPTRDIARLRLKDQAMSTSGIAEQSFREDGHTYGHVLDPRTGYPAENHQLVSVVAPCAGLADALSTAFFVMTLEEIQSYCEKHPETGVFALSRGRTPGSYQVHCIGLEKNSLEVLCKT